MSSTEIERLTGVTSPYDEILDALQRNGIDPSPLPLLQARIDFATAPLHIEACLKMTLEAAGSELTERIKDSRGADRFKTAEQFLLARFNQAWRPPRVDLSSGAPRPQRLVPESLPQMIQEFKSHLRQYEIPITECMEVALTEILAAGMRVLEEDNALLQGISRAYDNNPNYRHEVGRLVGIRAMALSGDFDQV